MLLYSTRRDYRVKALLTMCSSTGETFWPPFPPPNQSPGITKSKQRGVEPLDVAALPIYNTGERQGPKPRTYIEVTCQEMLENA